MRKSRRKIRESPDPLTNDELKIEYANLTINKRKVIKFKQIPLFHVDYSFMKI